MDKNCIYEGDCLEVLKTFPDESIDMCITSPPYWNLRDYGIAEQLGLETTPDKFVNNLCDVFDEVQRVLQPHGTCWVNLGDTYISGKSHQSIYKDKSLAMIPNRFAIEMVNRGWILRNELIWHKPNCMPESVKDRFTNDYEKLLFFTKNSRYYFKQQFEPLKESSITDGRNKRAVWVINPPLYKEAHFATFPEKLIESPIDAGCPKFVDKITGEPRVRTINSITIERYNLPKDHPSYRPKRYGGKYKRGQRYSKYQDKGYQDGRDEDEFISGVVLDPFFGSGTTGVVALRQGKDYIGIEINHSYIELAEKRLAKPMVERKTREKSKDFFDFGR